MPVVLLSPKAVAPPLNGDADDVVATPNADVGFAPNGLPAGVAGLLNTDVAAAPPNGLAAAAPPNGLAAVLAPNTAPLPAPTADGAPNAVVEPNGLAAAPPNAVLLLPPPNGVAACVAWLPNGDDAGAAALPLPNGDDALWNGLAPAPAPNGLTLTPVSAPKGLATPPGRPAALDKSSPLKSF